MIKRELLRMAEFLMEATEAKAELEASKPKEDAEGSEKK
jgi:hypothetical protein